MSGKFNSASRGSNTAPILQAYAIKKKWIAFRYKNYNKGKRKVELSPCLTKYHAMKTYWGSGDTAPRILDLGTRWR
jgi:hypothetical protein